MRKLKKAKIVTPMPQRYEFKVYDEADEDGATDDSCSRLNEIMKTPALRKSKYHIIILAVSDITTTVAPLTHRWQGRKKKTNCLLRFRVLNLKNFFMTPAIYDGQTMMNSR